MDSLITAAARALSVGDALGALNRVALRSDAPALALRGVAMAQLDDFGRARLLLRKAARAFGAREGLARARCTVAEAEIALVSRDLGWPATALEAARVTLESAGDRSNAAYARHLAIRRLLLIGHLDEAERDLAALDPTLLPPAARAAHELVVAGLAVRRLRTGPARAALARAEHSARQANHPALAAEVAAASQRLGAPVARLVARGQERVLLLDEVEVLLASGLLVVDVMRGVVVQGSRPPISLATRPVLFGLVRTLGEAWPSDVSRELLVRRAFGGRHADDSHRARLRVEIGRLRAQLRPVAEVRSTKRGFALVPHGTASVVTVAWPVEEAHAEVLALLADGEAWSSSALALALHLSQRTVQRALDALAKAGKVQGFGAGRSRRWLSAPLAGFTTMLLLPVPLPNG